MQHAADIRNRLLATLPPDDLARLRPKLEPVEADAVNAGGLASQYRVFSPIAEPREGALA